MNKLFLIALCCITIVTASAKSEPIDPKYGVGAVKVNSVGRVEFSEDIELPQSADLSKFYQHIQTWIKGRFTQPNVIKGEVLSENSESLRITMRVKQNLIFKNTALVTDMSKMNYNINFAIIEDGSKKLCRITLTDITYLYEEEREGGGISFTAEEWITDKEAFNKNKTKFLKATGKFRIATIDLFEQIVTQTGEAIKTL